jgi:prevent-host-death family protein
MCMTTQFINVREFRTNMADYAKKARKTGARFVVTSRNKPLFELTPFAEDATLDTLFADIVVAKKDVEEGRVHSEKNILAEFA